MWTDEEKAEDRKGWRVLGVKDLLNERKLMMKMMIIIKIKKKFTIHFVMFKLIE